MGPFLSAVQLKCDGTECCFEFKWNKKIIIDIGIEIGQLPHTGKLVAVTVNPVVKTVTDEQALALASQKVQHAIDGADIRKIIVVPDRLVNIVL